MNFVEGELAANGKGPEFVAGGRRLPLDGYSFARRPEAGRKVTLGVRPEHLGLGEAGTWPGFTVDIVEPMGADTVIWCSDGDRSIQVRTGGDWTATPGDRLALAIDPRRVSIFADTGERL
jgi:multiple sugar transport system ATP-binding protein